MNQDIDIKKGDKVLILRGDYQGQRGIIDDIQEYTVTVVLPACVTTLSIDYLQNFSSAARKAWLTRPNRSAGRPRDPDLVPKRMVSLRLEAEVWDELGRAVEEGIIRSREAAVNQWLHEKLDELRMQHISFEGQNS
jgi:hypothetical protein